MEPDAKVEPGNIEQTDCNEGNKSNDKDFFWSYEEEPHRSRRMEILKVHPEISRLCGPEPLTKWVVLFVITVQITTAYLIRNCDFFSWQMWIAAYVIGATANQNLFLAIHEISHNLAFKNAALNRYFAIITNLPIAVPYSAAFRPYHLEHHKYQGVDGIDTDLPTKLEAVILDSVLGKTFFATFQIFFYALRPMMVKRLPLTSLQLLNVLVQAIFDFVIYKELGINSLLYFLLSSFLAGSLHPCAGHFIAEHYVFDQMNKDKPTETYSYYGSLNLLTYNVGYHNEHHDFPYVAWTALPRIRDIAPEFYENLHHHDSWIRVLWDFIIDPNVGMYARVKRKNYFK